MAIYKRQSETHLDPREFDAEIEAHGTPALWRRARQCPCLSVKSGAANINCPFCFLYPGTLWDAGTPITIFAPGRSRRDRADEAGTWVDGVATYTFPSTAIPGHLDQIELTAAVIVIDDEVLERGSVDPLGRSLERLRFPHPLEVEFCEAIIGGNLAQFESPGDFELDAGAGVQWNIEIPEGTQYTMRYKARPVFVCWSPMSRDEHAQRMPYRVQCQRLDFFLRAPVGVD